MKYLIITVSSGTYDSHVSDGATEEERSAVLKDRKEGGRTGAGNLTL